MRPRNEWRQVPDFPDYEVNQYGSFVNAHTDRPIKISPLPGGHCKISLYEDGRIQTRSPAVLVARAFLSDPPERFDTVIHLDGDLLNCAAENLMWRPRWYAIKFHKQFSLDAFHNDYSSPRKIVDIDTGRLYRSIKDVCISEGVYCFDVQDCLSRESFTPVTGHRFRYA